jgi:serine/threonine protein phosphatase PrpC
MDIMLDLLKTATKSIGEPWRYCVLTKDSHTIKYNFDNIAGDGFFCIFDGHAGKGAAEYCGTYLNQVIAFNTAFYPTS